MRQSPIREINSLGAHASRLFAIFGKISKNNGQIDFL